MPRKNNDQHDPRQIMEDVLAIVRQAGRSGITSQQIALRLGIKDKGRRYLVFDALDVLLEEGRLTSGKKGRYHSPDGAGILAGTLEIIGSGAGFLRPEEGGRDVFIQQRDLGLALHGDRVKVKLRGGGGGRPEGKVLEVVERRRASYVGVVHRQQGRLLVVMDDPRINKPFFVPAVDSAKAKEGDKVVVELGDWRDPRDLPRGRIVDVLGRAGEHDVEMHAILAEFGLPHDFPEDVVRAAGSIRDDRGGTEYAKRRDMREVPTLTIDPEDAKDLDDALSIRQLDNGLWEVGVHIADVSHYVKPGSRVDQEAVSRATSVYLVDRVVPMLPERLSNDLCSLNADEDKLTFSAIFHLDEQARIKDEWFGRTVIRSRRRFAYAEAKEAIDGAKGALSDEVRALHALARVLRKDRLSKGALEIVTTEMKFRLDEQGRPLEVYEKIMNEANWLIEEFMLLANKRVATWVAGLKKGGAHPFVYRVHDHPDKERIAQLRALAKSFGHSLVSKKEEDLPHAINRLLREVRGTEEEGLLTQVVVRSMAKAVYTTENIGHYGLSFPYYTHFTSPIRRYPDLMVHRALAHYLDGGAPLDRERMDVLCKHSSNMEKMASDAERASIRYKQAEFLLERLGESFAGTISGITAWGVYVQLNENHCEGMIPLRDMPGDHYRFEEEKYQLVGQRSGRVFRLGDELEVTVRSVDMERRTVDLLPKEDAAQARERKARTASSRRQEASKREHKRRAQGKRKKR